MTSTLPTTRIELALREALRRHFEIVSPESLREQLLNVIEYDPRFLRPIPSDRRERFKALLTRIGERIFIEAFLGRYRGATRQVLEEQYEEMLMRIRRELHSAVLDWDRARQQQNRGPLLAQTYPKALLMQSLMRPLRDIFATGMQEGYLARMRHLGEEVAQGLSPASAQALIRQEFDDVMTHGSAAARRAS